MSTNLIILSQNEIKLCDNPPEFNNYQRIINFSFPKWATEIINNLKTDENKLIFSLLLGYFKFSKKFYTPKKFHKRDIIYVSTKLNLNIDYSKIESFKRNTLIRYHKIILNNLGVQEFSQNIKNALFVEAKDLVKKMYKPKNIFASLIEYLLSKNIEISYYNSLADLITKAFNDYEKEIFLINRIPRYFSPR